MTLDLDEFIKRHVKLCDVWNNKRLKYTAQELHELAKMSIDTFKNEASLVRMNPPCIIVGDIHGQYMDLIRMFAAYNKKKFGALCNRFVFLGDYVDRGKQSMECLALILALKIKFPTKYQVLRGNHECQNVNFVYGFKDELVERLGEKEGLEVFFKFNEVFSWMPLAALVGRKILCMHGGISPDLKSLEDIEKIARPLPDPAAVPLALDLLWADPQENLSGFIPNTVRTVSQYFGEDEVFRVCKDLNVLMIVRGHQMMMSGFGEFANRKLITIFSAPRYQADNSNAGATMTVDAEGRIGITVMIPMEGIGIGEDNELAFTDTNNSKESSVSVSTGKSAESNGKSSEGVSKSSESKSTDGAVKSSESKSSEDVRRKKSQHLAKKKPRRK